MQTSRAQRSWMGQGTYFRNVFVKVINIEAKITIAVIQQRAMLITSPPSDLRQLNWCGNRHFRPSLFVSFNCTTQQKHRLHRSE